MLALKDVVGRVDLAYVVHDARVTELLNERALKTEPLGDRLDIPADTLQVRTGRAVLDRRGEQQVAYALQARAPQLLARDPLLLQRALQLLPALALAAEHPSEILGVARRLLLHERHLLELVLELGADALLALVDLREVERHAHGLRVRHIGNTHGLMEELAEHVAARNLRKIRIAWRDVDSLDHVLGVVVAHRFGSLSYAPGSRGSCR